MTAEIAEEDRACVNTATAELRLGHVVNIQYRIHRPDGDLRWVKVTAFPVRNSEGRVYSIANIATDITEFKNIQQKLKSATRSALTASKVKTQFLANMSHEIRTPLSAVLGFTELIARTSQAPDIRDWIEIIQRNGNHLLGLIDEILDISQIEANRFEVDFSPTDPQHEAEEAILLLANRARQKNLDLQVRVEGKIPRNISCDPTRLRQILINLVGNAIKFTEKGFVHLTIRSLEGNGAPRIEFLVEDSGKGIPQKQRARLFKPFVQGDPSTKRTFGGTGLGLAISLAYARALGGTVDLLKSGDGQGTTFSVKLPTEIRAPAHGHTEVRTQPRTSTQNELKNIRVLVVDDAPDNRELISLFLTKSGASVECAENGVEGIRKATDKDFDVILMDIQMPGIDGVDTTKRLRAANYVRPILALTAHAMKGERDRYLQSGFDDHLSKPINPQALIAAVARYSQPTVH
jgi:signal transduction histidine kinase/CheY-like chemotaxis protein